MGEPVLITGSGIVSAIGLNKKETLAALLGAQSGIAPLRHLETLHTEFLSGEVRLSDAEMMERLHIPPGTPVNRTALMGMMALEEALNEAAIDRRQLPGVALISGTTVGGMDQTERHYLDFMKTDRYDHYISIHDCGAGTNLMAGHFGRFAFVTTLSTACSSAANAIILGANMIRGGEASIVAVGGSECLTKYHLNGFNSLMILDPNPCRPFDESRAGLNLGEGAAFLILESAASAASRGVKPEGILSGYGNACDAFHQTASSENGEGAYLAMKEALEDAGLRPEDIDYINAHGTGTPNNDATEGVAMQRLFGDKLPPVSSTKSATGHTTSASGAIETVICLLALQHQFLPVNCNWRNPMPGGILPVTDIRALRPLRHVICNSFGFGGNDSSLLLTNPAAL